MTDKITNGDFSYPNIIGFQGEVGGVQYYDTFSEGQKDIFIWVGSDGDLSVQNNDNGITSFGYPDITLLNIQGSSGLNLYQYVSFENTACLYQSFNLTKIGEYTLSFLYVSRPNFVLNNLQIFFNNVLLDVISTPQTSWTEYSLSFPVSATGSYTLFLQGQPDITDANIAITNIKLIEPPSIIGGGITVYNNNFKSTNINGYLNVVSTSSIIGQITTGFLTCNRNLTMPANGTNSIYYRDISNNTIGRLFGTQLQIYMDFYNIMAFRNCSLNGKIIGNKLNINDKGIVVNSNTTTSYYHLDVYGNAGAYIRGPLRVLNDITYSDSVSLITSINTLSGRIFTISGLVNTNRLNILSLSSLVYTNTNTLSITSLSGLVYTNTLGITSLSGRLNTANLNISSLSGLINTANLDIISISGRLNTANTNIATANTDITSISGRLNTANSNIATNTLDITSLSGRLNIAHSNIGTNTLQILSLSGRLNTANTNINTLTNKLTKINYVSSNNNTFISSIPTTFIGLNYADGGLIMHNTSPIWNRVGVQQYTGNGFFYNTNGGSRTDFINYLGNANASSSIGGFEFWLGSLSYVPYVVATINYLGSLSISGITTSAIVATNNISASVFTATSRIFTPYITLNNLYDVGRSITISGNITLTFPLPQIIFCNCSTSAVNITLPDIASLAATSNCRIQIRRILNTSNQINLLCFGTQQRIYSTTNVLGSASNAIGNNCQLLLNGNFWYSTSG